MNVIHLEVVREAKKETIKGIEFLVSVSPYFFPQRLELEYDEDSGCLIINFKYLDEEPGEKSGASDSAITLIVGKNTSKLLSTEIHVDRLDIDHVRMLVTDTATKAIQRAKGVRPDLLDNYDIAVEALQVHGNEIAAVAAPA